MANPFKGSLIGVVALLGWQPLRARRTRKALRNIRPTALKRRRTTPADRLRFTIFPDHTSDPRNPSWAWTWLR